MSSRRAFPFLCKSPATKDRKLAPITGTDSSREDPPKYQLKNERTVAPNDDDLFPDGLARKKKKIFKKSATKKK